MPFQEEKRDVYIGKCQLISFKRKNRKRGKRKRGKCEGKRRKD
jgi:hypothetical protein